MRIMLSLATVFLAVAAFAACAVDIGGLHSARVRVNDRSDAEFKRGVSRALERVIVKLTGDSTTPRSDAGRSIVAQAKRLVQQFGYERPRNSSPNSNDLVLRVEFDARVLSEEMRSRNLVVWGKERPETLVWLIIDNARGRKLLGAEDAHQMLRAVKNHAATRGIPLVFPLADIGEASTLAEQVTSTALVQAVTANSEKYAVSSILLGHLRQIAPSLWENHWTLQVGAESIAWDQQGDIVELLVEDAIDGLADALGRRYAGPAQTGHRDVVAVTITGLRSAADYARTERYLSSLDSVVNLSVRRVDEHGIIFDLTVRGGLLTLSQSISFGQTLSSDPAHAAVFRLNPR